MKLFKLVLIFFLVSCNSNPLRTDENSLKRSLLSKISDNKSSESKSSNKDSIPQLPVGFRYRPKRTIDKGNPPASLDFTNKLPVKKLKLSEIASRVRYVVLEVPDDSAYFGWFANIQFAGDNIIVNNNLGIHRFSTDGRYLEMICKNNVDFPHDKVGFISKETFQGAWIDHVDVAGNSVFYKYTDYPNKKVTLFRYNLNQAPTILSQPGNDENNPPDSFTMGDPIISGMVDLTGETDGLYSARIHAISDDFYSGIPRNNARAFAEGSALLTVFNKKGDTLCIFPQHDLLSSPITASVIRSFGNLTWFNEKVPSYKWAFNDTVFRLIPPDKLFPSYVFDFGDRKISADEWLHVNMSLKGKMTVTGLLENPRYLFITWRYYPNDNVQGSITHKAIYDKSSGMLFDPGLPEIKMEKPPAIGATPVHIEYKPAGI